jgi:NTP pyrophosphatase (non-canonical NTP hydrolase)
MTEFTLNDYQKAATATCAPSFYGKGIDPAKLTLALSDAAVTCERLDAYKRSLFYDDRVKYGLDQGEGMEMNLPNQEEIDILHAVIGIVTEAGELAEGYITTGDRVNLKEEGGDLMWYIALLAKGLGTDLSDMGLRNIAKLSVRYPDKVFSTSDAINRRLEQERHVLENAS